MLKRGFDILLSLFGLIILSPLFLLIAALIKLDSRGPVFFSQIRIGRHGKPFKMLKFRTMMEVEHWTGLSLSPRNDPRVTSFGALLRRLKANELPQLFNVVRGQMSLVGPRPEVPEFVRLYGGEKKRMLSVRPGIVGPSQIRLRNEEELFSGAGDPTDFYIKYILPRKLVMDLEYVNRQSFLRDIGYVLQGIWVTAAGAITRRHLFENSEQITLFFCDAFVCGASYFFAYFLRMEGTFHATEMAILLHTMPYVVIVRMLALTYFGLYATLIRYVSFAEIMKIVKAATLSSVVIILLTFFIGKRGHPRSVFVIDWFILVHALGAYRLLFKGLKERIGPVTSGKGKNILIYGVGNMADLALRYVRTQTLGSVVAFVDDDPKKMRKSFQGVKVLGTRHDIEALVRLYDVDQILIAKEGINSEDISEVKAICEKADVACEVFALAN